MSRGASLGVGDALRGVAVVVATLTTEADGLGRRVAGLGDTAGAPKHAIDARVAKSATHAGRRLTDTARARAATATTQPRRD